MAEQLLDVDAVATMIGVETATIYSLVFRKRLPCLKISRRMLRFKLADIEAWLQSKAQAVVPDPIQQRPRRQSTRPVKKSNQSIDAMVDAARKEAENGK